MILFRKDLAEEHYPLKSSGKSSRIEGNDFLPCDVGLTIYLSSRQLKQILSFSPNAASAHEHGE